MYYKCALLTLSQRRTISIQCILLSVMDVNLDNHLITDKRYQIPPLRRM